MPGLDPGIHQEKQAGRKSGFSLMALTKLIRKGINAREDCISNANAVMGGVAHFHLRQERQLRKLPGDTETLQISFTGRSKHARKVDLADARPHLRNIRSNPRATEGSEMLGQGSSPKNSGRRYPG